jgi:hypothetical protein
MKTFDILYSKNFLATLLCCISRDTLSHLLAELALVINLVRAAESLGHAPGGLSNIDPVLDEVTDTKTSLGKTDLPTRI